MMTSLPCFILGAADPEMAAIEALVREAGCRVLYAAVEDRHGRVIRVSPRVAGKATHLLDPETGEEVHPASIGGASLVECRLVGTREDRQRWLEAREYDRVANGRGGDPAAWESAWEDRYPLDPDVIAMCDHHDPGDLGYGLPPAAFLPGSSLGQVISLLARAGIIGEGLEGASILWPGGGGCGDPLAAAGALAHVPEAWGHPGGWIVHIGPPVPADHRRRAAWVPLRLVLIAAADHCLAAAYAGQCPGVEPAALAEFRAAERGAWLARGPGQGRDDPRSSAAAGEPLAAIDREGASGWTRVVRGAIARTIEAVRTAPMITLSPGWGCYHRTDEDLGDGWYVAEHDSWCSTCESCTSSNTPGVVPWVQVRDLRDLGMLPELPAALAQMGECGLYRIMPLPGGGDPRVKIGLMGAGVGSLPGPEPVEAFLVHWATSQGLIGLYPEHDGTPEGLALAAARGFAGGYEPSGGGAP